METVTTRSALLLCLLVAMVTVVRSQDCTRNDGQFGTDLSVNVNEWDGNFNVNLDDRRAILPLNGNLGNNGLSVNLFETTQSSLIANDYFVIESLNGQSFGQGIYVRMRTALDRDGNRFDDPPTPELNSVTFGLNCITNGQTSTYTLIINLIDVNDNSPVFTNLPGTIQLDEETPVGSDPFFQVTAIDKDRADVNGRVEYSIFSGQANQKFRIDSTTGEITVLERLNFESQSIYALVIRASDQGTPSLSTSAFFNITLIDKNDNPPVFVANQCVLFNGACILPKYTTSVVSGSTSLGLNMFPNDLRARDGDATLRDPIIFSIYRTIPAGLENRFSVSTNPITANDGSYTTTLMLPSAINRFNLGQTNGIVTVYIEAVENNVLRKASYAEVDVAITAANQFPPSISVGPSNNGIIAEDAKSGDYVRSAFGASSFLRFTFNDQDYLSTDTFPTNNYQISTSLPGLFSVTADGYLQLLNNGLDYETAANNPIALEVVIRDVSTQQSSTAIVSVSIQDANDNSPVFPGFAYTGSFLEGTYNTFNPSTITTVSATDADANSFISYTIASVNNDAGSKLFVIDSSSGRISPNGTFAPTTYTVQVSASDGVSSAQTLVLITVTDVANNIPSFPANLYNIVVSEGVLTGSSVFQANATDPDSVLLSYSIQNIGFNQNQQLQDFQISSSGLVTVSVSGNNGNNINTGLKRLDRESRDSYVYLITARDSSFNSATATLSITLTDINDNTPFFNNQNNQQNNIYFFNVDENTGTTVIGTVTATDADEPNTVNSQIFYNLRTTGLFTINSASGAVSTTGSLNFESQSQYTFIVEAADSASDSRTGTATISVSVNDVQDEIPLFTDAIVTVFVNENANIGTAVTQLTAIDRDSIPDINFEITSQSGNEDFSVQTSFNGVANILVAKSLNYETRSFYTVIVSTIAARGSNIPQSSVQLTINVVDVNRFAPTLDIPNSQINVADTLTVGSVLTQVSATDSDNLNNNQQGVITFRVTSVVPAADYFVLHATDGRLFLVKSLTEDNLNNVNQYTLTIEAEDGDNIPRTTTGIIVINVNTNNGPPVFPAQNYFQAIEETLGVGNSVLTVSAQDNDGTNIKYDMVLDTIGGFYFVVNEGSGILTVRNSLLSDDAQNYVVRIRATDSGGLTSTATAQIQVNRNLNNPEWLVTDYQNTIEENYALTTEILRLSARDLDSQAPYNSLTFSVLNNNQQASNYFEISNTGVLTLRNSLVGLGVDQFVFNVALSDQGSPSLQATETATVTINVNRNTFAPLFFNSTYYTTILETLTPGQSVITITAEDRDTSSQFNQISFEVIGDDNAPDFFTVTSTSFTSQAQAVVRIRSSLTAGNQDRYYVRVVARDNGSPFRSAVAVVIVDITRNFQTPVWTTTSYFANIPENQNLGIAFATVSANDGDATAPHSIVNYELETATYNTGNNNEVDVKAYFQINALTGQISLRQSLLDEVSASSRYTLTVRAYDLGTPERSTTQRATVTVTVFRNLSPPEFVQLPYSTTISQSEALGQSIYRVTAVDNDASLNNVFGEVTYRLLGLGGSQNYFSMDEGTGVISSQPGLAVDTSTSYTLIVQAYDNGYPSRTDTEVVTITVNRNTQAPVFFPLSYNVNIFETQILGETFTRVTATDPDALSGNLNIVEYTATGSQAALQYFSVNSATGEVSARRRLQDDNSQNTVYTLTVQARDFGTPQLQSPQTTVIITVIRNRFTPQFINTPYTRDISQSSGQGTSVFQVTATDADTNQFNSITYSIVGEAFNLFSIDQQGIITPRQSLFGRSEATYTVGVQASDNGIPSKVDYEIVILTISRNENTPSWNNPSAFNNYQATQSVLENANFNLVIYTFQAQDLDQSAPYNTLKYTVVGDGSASQYFSVGETNGQVSLRSALYQDTVSQYILKVTLADQAGRSNVNTATLTVNVIRNQFTPRFLNEPYSTTITEGFGNSQTIFQVTAVDDDPTNTFDSVSYSVIGDGNAVAFFTVSQSGQISIIQSLASIPQTTYSLRIRAFDNGIPARSNTSVVIITIDRNQNSPIFNPTQYSASIADLGNLGTSVITVTASDADTVSPYNTVRYRLISDYFIINEASGQIYVARNVALDPNRPPSYTLIVEAYDLGIPQRTSTLDANVFISVQRNQFDPSFINSPYIQRIEQTRGIGSFVTRVTATDSDQVSPFGDVTLSLIGDDSGTLYFNFDPNSGNVTVARSLTLDSTDSFYRLRIEARDGGVPARAQTALVEITVLRNLVNPEFTQLSYENTIDETHQLADSIIQISARDTDVSSPNNVITYTMVNNFNTLASQYFQINPSTGTITLKQSLLNDPTDETRFTFTVSLTDNGIEPLNSRDTANVVINVRRNIAAPFFISTPYQTQINYTIASSSQVFTVEARDNDDAPYNVVAYSIIGDDDGPVFFRIDQNGVIRTSQSIRTQTKTTYVVRVLAQDNGSPRLSATAAVTINVARNIFAPAIQSNNFLTTTINENMPPSTSILRVSATDSDATSPNNDVRYYFNGDVTRFSLDSVTGVISVRTNLYGENQNSFEYTVYAQDLGSPVLSSPSVPVTINIRRNNNAPTFINEIYTQDVTDRLFAGSTILRVTATDDDAAAPFNSLRYQIVGDDLAPIFFTINEFDGQIRYTTNQNTGLASSSVYRVRVTVYDGGIPSLSDTTVVYLNITQNRFSPSFSPSNYNLQIPENQDLGVSVGRVTATDQDQFSPYNDVSYNLTGNSRALEYFQIQASTGILSLIKPLYSDVDQTSYSLTVSVRDLGTPSNAGTNTANVVISVTRNQFPPIFVSSPYVTTISKNVISDASIYRFTVSDQDSLSPFNQVSVSIIGDETATSLFRLQSDGTNVYNVRVTNTGDLAADTDSQYQLRLQAVDGGNQFGFGSLTAVTLLTINVQRNTAAPFFTHFNSIQVTIDESAPIGTFIVDLNATDADTTVPENTVFYQITTNQNNQNIQDIFFINPNTGRITLLQSFLVNANNFYRIQVRAYDGGFPTRTADTNVDVTVLRVTDTLEFSSQNYFETIQESLSVSSGVTRVIAQPGPGVIYSLTGFSDGPDYFNISSTSGDIQVRSDLRLDLNKKTTYTLQVRATRSFTSTNAQEALSTVTISVTRNLNTPIFTQQFYDREVSENLALGSSIVQLSANDGDIFDVISYSSVTQGGFGSPIDNFYTGPSTGLISLRRVLTDTTINSYQFLAIARDQSSPERTGTATVRITVRRSTSPPFFVNNAPYFTSIDINTAPGSVIYTQSRAIDQDIVGDIQYTVTGQYFSAAFYFGINGDTGDIFVRNNLNTDISLSYILGIAAIDTGYPSQVAMTNISISVNRNINAPSFFPTDYERNIPESYQLGLSLVQVAVSDDDGEEVVCTISSATTGNNNNNNPNLADYFYLNPYTCLLTVQVSLTTIGTNQVILNIQARDNGTPPRQAVNNARVVINIFRNENNPFFLNSPYRTTISESTELGTSVLTVSARDDDDANQAVTLTLIGDETTSTYFNFNTTNGRFTVARSLLLETRDVYVGRIVARDNGSPARSATALAFINIQRNENRPTFTQTNYQYTVRETDPISTLLGRLSAEDTDRISPYNTFVFSVTNLNFNNQLLTYFSLDSTTGELRIRIPLYTDNSDTLQFSFTVGVTDGGGLTGTNTANVQITIIRNRFPPVFSNTPYSTTIPFSINQAVTVFDVNTTDADVVTPYNSVTYSIIGDGTAVNRFFINSNGIVTATASGLLNDVNSFYTVRVLAQDGGTPRLSATATINIGVDRNLNRPVFQPQNYSVTVNEIQDLGVAIRQLQAFDQDVQAPYNALVYTAVDRFNFDQAFDYVGVTRLTGEIYIRQSLTLIATNVLVLEVSVRDNDPTNSLTAERNAFVTVNIVRNENAPQFADTACEISLDSQNNQGFLRRVTATDGDSINTPFGQVRYSIIGDGVATQGFAINEVTGDLSIAGDLGEFNVEEYSIRIQARDLGITVAKYGFLVCRVSVQQNFQAPFFVDQSYSQNVIETFTLGETILAVSARDNDPLAPHNTVRYRLTRDPEDLACFLINEVTGALTLKRSLLYEPCRSTFFFMRAQAYDLGSPALTGQEVNITVSVTRNNNAPFFISDPYFRTLNETALPGISVYQTSASDQDNQTPFNTLTYSIIGDDTAPSYFTIDATTGLVSLTNRVVLDTLSTYRVRLQVNDGGIPSLSGTATLTVSINRNLFSPAFQPTTYEETIFDDQILGETILTVFASDLDIRSPHNVLRYAADDLFNSGNALTYFAVREEDGAVYARRSLNFDNFIQSQYRFTVRVYDLGSPSRLGVNQATVTINVIRNQNCPIFQNLPGDITIPRTQQFNTRVYDVNATDADPAGRYNRITYSLIGDDSAQVLFRIDQTTGFIFRSSNNGIFNDESSQYTLRVRAVDGASIGQCTTDSILRVNVERNEFAPVWFPNAVYETTILETQTVVQPVYTVTAQDSDIQSPNNIITYSIASYSANQGLFYINPNGGLNPSGGQVYLRTSIINTNVARFEISLIATDGGFPAKSANATLFVNVLRNQEAPVFSNEPYTTTISRNQIINTNIYTVTATDADIQAPFNTLEFDIIGDGVAPNFFRIDSTSGAIFLINSVSTDATDVYYIRVRVQDGGNPRLSDITQIIVYVNRNLFAPIFIPQQYSREILDTQSVGVEILRITATDADATNPHNIVRYELRGDALDLQYFLVDSITGIVTLRQSVYNNQVNSQQTSFSFQGYAYDLGQPFRRNSTALANIFISVIRNNFPPQFITEPYNTQIAESQQASVSIFRVSAVDQDTRSPFNEVRFDMIGDDAAPQFFTIDEITGVISLRPNTNLEFDNNVLFTARVRALDGGSPSRTDTSTVSILVLRNLFAPAFNHSGNVQRTIVETSPIGTFIYDIDAFDNDRDAPENTVRYEIQSSFGNSGFFLINPETGVITLLLSVLNTNTDLYSINVIARDGGSPPRFATTFVEVTILRETGTLRFSLPGYSVTIAETRTVNDIITTARANPGPATYSIINNEQASVYFAIGSNGAISVLRDLRSDPAYLTFYRFQIQAVSQGILSQQTATAFVNVTVVRNANAPLFTPDNYARTIPENLSVGRSVVQLTANDADGDTIRYSVIDGTEALEYFYLNPSTGLISINKLIYKVGQDVYQFTVQATDQRINSKTDTANVRIQILRDVFPPNFQNDPFSGSVSELDNNGTLITSASCFDQDLRGTIVYQPVQFTVAPAFFAINSFSGRITLYDRTALRLHPSTTYTFRVQCFDSAYPDVVDISDVIISVTRNLNPPIFSSPRYQQVIPETYSLGEQILQVSATDADLDSVTTQ